MAEEKSPFVHVYLKLPPGRGVKYDKKNYQVEIPQCDRGFAQRLLDARKATLVEPEDIEERRAALRQRTSE